MAYIYRHRRLDNGEVFYVGLSLKNDPKHSRAYSRGDRRNNYWRNIINTTEYEVHIIEDNLEPEEAKEKEKYYIALYGRKDLGLGTLCNFTDGGEGMLGYKKSEEQRRKISERQMGELNHRYGKTVSEETREKYRIASSLRKHSEETKAKMREMRLGELNPNYGKSPSEETREKNRIASTGRKHSEETKKRMSEMFSGENGPNYGKRGELCPQSKLVLDIETGIFYASSRDAFNDLSLKMSERHFRAMLTGRYPNKTSCVRV